MSSTASTPESIDAQPTAITPKPVDVLSETRIAQSPDPESSNGDTPTAPIAGTLRQGQWLKVRLIGNHTYFWSDGPFEFGVPPQRPKKANPEGLQVNGVAGSLAMIRPLAPGATTIWYRNLDGQ